mgnify:CR=1 FL=1
MCPVLAPNVAQMFTPVTLRSDAMRQFELNLTPRNEHHGSIEPWVYRFETGTLLEELDMRRHVYGLWDKLFGCWKIDTGSHTSHEIVPTWVPLNSRGIWRDPLDIRFENAPKASWLLSPKWRYEANAAFVAYFDGIPKRIRRLVGGLEDFQWLALDLIWQVPEFAAFLDDEIHEKRIQYFFACCALAGVVRMPRTERWKFAKSIMATRRPEFLTRLSGIKCTKSTIRILYKLGTKAQGANCYQFLLRAAHEPAAAKVFAHAPRIKPAGIEAWLELPEPARLPNLLGFIIAEPDIFEDLGEIARQIPKDMPAIWDRMEQALSTVCAASDIAEWEERILDEVDFPKAPFAGCEQLRPLNSGQEMRREAREMHNCLVDMISTVLRGRAYFYHWDGPLPSTVMLEPCSGGGWYVSEILGRDNAVIAGQSVRRITRLIEQRLRMPSPNTQSPNQLAQEALFPCKPIKNRAATRQDMQAVQETSAGSCFQS